MRRRSFLIESRKLVLTGKEAHQHACGHFCFCTLTPLDTPNCKKCRHAAFEAYRDSLDTAALIERQA